MKENRQQTLRSVIVEAFLKSRLTEKAFSKALSVHPRTAHRILTEDGLYIDTPTLGRIADTLGLDYDALAAIRPPFPTSPKIISTSDDRFDEDEEKRMAEFIGGHHDNG